jgi:hypothetical protein
MKYIKILGLTALAAAALMTFVGAGVLGNRIDMQWSQMRHRRNNARRL